MLASGVGYTDTLEDRLPRRTSAGSVNSYDLDPLRSSTPPVELSCGNPRDRTSSVRPTPLQHLTAMGSNVSLAKPENAWPRSTCTTRRVSPVVSIVVGLLETRL